MEFGGETRMLRDSPEVFSAPELPNDEKEIRESLAFKKGIIALDVVFDASGKPFVLEIQGLDSGIEGLREALADDIRVSNEVRQFARSYKRNGFDYRNPTWFGMMTQDKSEHLAFIPERHKPQSVVNGDFDDMFDKGKVIIKPLYGSQGWGVRIFDSSQKEEARAYASRFRGNYGFVAQSFIESSGAELAPEHLKGHAASLRLLVPFEVIDGKPEITVHGVGYQRVARESMEGKGSDGNGYDEAGVVNLHRNAQAVPMSQSEYDRVLPVAETILKNLTTHEERSRHYRDELKQKLEYRTTEAYWPIIKAEGWSPIVHVRTSGARSLEEARDANRFIHFINRELSLLSEETLEALPKQHVYATIAHTSGKNGEMNLRKFGGLSGFIGFDVTVTFTTQDPPGTLTRILEDITRGRKPRERRRKSGRRSLDVESERVQLPLDMGVPTVY